MANYIIIGGDGKEYGPVTDADVRQWLAEGRLNGQSQAKAESDAEFRPLEKFPEFAATFASSQPSPLTPLNAVSSLDWQTDILKRPPDLKLGECLAAGWSFLGKNTGFVVALVFLTWLMNFVFVFVSLSVPLVGPFIYLAFSGVIIGGFYLACLRRMRNESVSPTAVFSGFQDAFLQLLLVSLVTALLTEISVCFCILPAIYLGVAWAFAVPLVADKKLFFWTAMELSRKVVTRVWFEVFVLLIIVFLPMVIFQIFNLVQMGGFFTGLFNAAHQNWQQLAQDIQHHHDELHGLTIKMTLIGQAFLLVNLFYCGGALMHAYENLFGTRKP